MNIRHIADKAGVSVATVSRVLNHPETVAEKTRKKIEDIIKEEEYTPNWFARGLNFNKTRTIGLIISDILSPAAIEICKGIEDVAHSKDYTTLMCNGENDLFKERKYLQILIQRKVDGIIMLQPCLEEKDYAELRENNIPSVVIGDNFHISGSNTITIDSRGAAYRIVEHLANIGYEDIAIIQGNTPVYENEEKYIGYRKALEEFGLRYYENFHVKEADSIEGGYLGAKHLLEQSRRPDAIFATSDSIAFGVMDAMSDFGLSIPKDIALVGFDNVRMSSLMTPKLTTMEKPLHKMGVMGARLLMDFINEEENAFREEGRQIQLMAKLKIRKSCGHKERIEEMF